MIDLVSTHEGIEEETRNAAHLVAGVIAMAIEDLCLVPTTEEIQNNCNLRRHAIGSLNFFFNPKSMFPAYASMIGLEATSFRAALERRKYEDESDKKTKIPYLKVNEVKAMRLRIHWWQKSPVQSRQLELEL